MPQIIAVHITSFDSSNHPLSGNVVFDGDGPHDEHLLAFENDEANVLDPNGGVQAATISTVNARPVSEIGG